MRENMALSSVESISNDPKYTIKTVCDQTGILPVTLRAWERRHEVLNPQRGENRYRLYSDRDIATLRWIKNRIDSGISISSAVAELRQMQNNGGVLEAAPEIPFSDPKPVVPPIPPEQTAHRLYLALIKHDETLSSDLLRDAYSMYDLNTYMLKTLIPALVEIGEAWANGVIPVATEHFASAFLRGNLLTIFQAFPARSNAPYILVGCAPTELHEIGSLMMAVMLRSDGYRVEYLGPDLPLDDLVDYAKYERPGLVVMAATSPETAELIDHLQEKLAKLKPAPKLGYGGSAFGQQPDLIGKTKGFFLGYTLDAAIVTVNELLPKTGKSVRSH
jgi:DNA-binding transcriptional MerR regulator/methylmalonyl-CoA mutase cobalamin-binding subunit